MRVLKSIGWLVVVAAVGAIAVGPAAAARHRVVPTVKSVNPSSAKVGATVTIAGANLTGVKSVKIGGVVASFKPVSATTLKATVPTKSKPGWVIVVVTTASGIATGTLTIG